MPALDIFGSFADPLKQDQGAAKLLNCRVIVRRQEEQKLAKTRLVGSPGLTQISHPTTSPCIVLCHAVNTIWSGHEDGSIYSGVETNAPVHQGSVAVGNPPIIRMAEDRTCLAIASNSPQTNNRGGSGYTASIVARAAVPAPPGGLSTPAYPPGVSFADFQTSINFDPSSVCVLDNYTVWAGASNSYANQSDKMFSSYALTPGVVDANAWATAEARADSVLDVVTLGRMFWPFGTRSVEMWYDPGGQVDFKFTNFTNSLVEVGLAARRTLASMHGKALWVGTDRRVWMGAGQSAQPVSPSWVDLLLQQIDLTNLTSYMYAQGGDEFYMLTLEGEWSIEMAVSTMTWVYRQTSGRADHASRCAVEHDGGICYVGLDTGEICTLDMSTASEPAGQLQRTITTMWVGLQEARNVINQIDVTSYMGPDAGTFTLDWSEDRQITWKGRREITWPEPGTRRAIARAMGTSRRRQVRLNYQGSQAPFEMDEFFVVVSEEGQIA
jgi:hypothetical protein